MNLGKISVRYARALFHLALGKGVIEQVSADMKLLYQAIKEVPAFHYFINNPVMPLPEKKKHLHRVFKDRIHQVTMDFIDLIIKNNRLQYLEGMARQFHDQYKEHQGITEVVMTTVTPLDKSIRERMTGIIKEKTSRQVVYQEVADPGIIGGFVLKIEDEQIDASVATHLQKIRKGLKKEHRS